MMIKLFKFSLLLLLFFLPTQSFTQVNLEQLAKDYLSSDLTFTEMEKVIQIYKSLGYEDFKKFLAYQEKEEKKMALKTGLTPQQIEKNSLEVRTRRLKSLNKSMELFNKPYNQLTGSELRQLVYPPEIRPYIGNLSRAIKEN